MDQDTAEPPRNAEAGIAAVRHIILVLSGKGGVGKSTVAVNLAAGLRDAGKQVGLLDLDLHGPSLPTMLGLAAAEPQSDGERILPVLSDGIAVMSIGFLLESPASAVVWRGSRKAEAIQQFLDDVAWGPLDHLVIDLPPGTGDEVLAVAQALPQADGAVIVAAPQAVANADVRRSITFCQHLDLPILGLIENMRGFVCPDCGTVTDIFGSGGGEQLATELELPFLGSIPIDRAVASSGDGGRPYVHPGQDSETARRFRAAIATLLADG
ncbi:MAG: Mrp/NBP35 family ATP-binding protein [Planctomycetota bacterium]